MAFFHWFDTNSWFVYWTIWVNGFKDTFVLLTPAVSTSWKNNSFSASSTAVIGHGVSAWPRSFFTSCFKQFFSWSAKKLNPRSSLSKNKSQRSYLEKCSYFHIGFFAPGFILYAAYLIQIDMVFQGATWRGCNLEMERCSSKTSLVLEWLVASCITILQIKRLRSNGFRTGIDLKAASVLDFSRCFCGNMICWTWSIRVDLSHILVVSSMHLNHLLPSSVLHRSVPFVLWPRLQTRLGRRTRPITGSKSFFTPATWKSRFAGLWLSLPQASTLLTFWWKPGTGEMSKVYRGERKGLQSPPSPWNLTKQHSSTSFHANVNLQTSAAWAQTTAQQSFIHHFSKVLM